jgi:hypothetical protein
VSGGDSDLGVCTMCEEAPATTTWGFPVCQDCADGLDVLHTELQQMEAADPELAAAGERAEAAFKKFLEGDGDG